MCQECITHDVPCETILISPSSALKTYEGEEKPWEWQLDGTFTDGVRAALMITVIIYGCVTIMFYHFAK